jgi:hypothetical protein
VLKENPEPGFELPKEKIDDPTPKQALPNAK